MAIVGSVDLGDGVRCVTVTHDPSSVSTNLPKGSFIIEESTGFYWHKRADGDNTDVVRFDSGGALTANFNFEKLQTVRVNHGLSLFPDIDVVLTNSPGHFGRENFGVRRFGRVGGAFKLLRSEYTIYYRDHNALVITFKNPKTGVVIYG